MARRGGVLMTKTKMLLFREANMRVVGRCFSKFVSGESKGGRRSSSTAEVGDDRDDGNAEGLLSSCWVPHPRTGIYVPKGHERVIDDVPDGAASFNQTYWLREVDGVEKPDPYLPSNYCYFQTLSV
ncbi:hypothetical protein FNV43_RR22615 [Rhamnella rubrinervis]|uniref:Late embryogenesis abundant protein n=1 Tax=Rhamnella rubrinervis TaxID=2594499 RepID=A0A8K0DVK4_9ROSA|nr:hypothetical protein FNV43_RR22615 [Rhamnella rubrinervis]